MIELPTGWDRPTLPQVVEVNPSNPDVVPVDEDLVSFVPMAAVDAMTGRLNPADKREWQSVRKGYKRFQESDILFAKITPCMENGKVALAKGLHGGIGAGSTEFHVLRPYAGIEPTYVLWYMLSERTRRDARAEMTGTAGQLRVPERFLDELLIEIPPSAEQSRIVTAVESYFTRLDDAVASLERVQRNLKRYRASVVKAAVEGRLVPTEAELARQEGRDYEPASVLLQRILKERRRRWEEAELAKLKARGKTPANDKWKAKYKEPVIPDTEGLPELPEGWCWTTVDAVSWEVRYGTSSKTSTDQEGGVPVLRMGNIEDGNLNYSSLKYLPDDHEEFPELLLDAGDLLFNRTNSAELVGKSAVFHGQRLPCSLASYLIRVRFIDGAQPDFVGAFINSSTGRKWIASVVSQQVGQANVNGTKLKACALPLPPACEQRRIVTELERLGSYVRAAEVGVSATRSRCSRLRQAILKWAFEGRLVDQDPNDEPASVLLERIRADREKAEAAEPNRKTRRKKRASK